MKIKQIRVDGYKNLVNCKVDLGDFNILVGPNNSGKSNFLEAVQMLWPICFGDDKIREGIFQGMCPRQHWGTSICHLEKHSERPMCIGVSFEIMIESECWTVDFEVKAECVKSEKGSTGFVSERLRGKPRSRRGPATTFLNRRGGKLTVGEKTHSIAKDMPSLLVVRSVYPDFKGLPSEFPMIFKAIASVCSTKIFAISAKNLREAMRSEKSVDAVQVSSFDLLLVADNIKKTKGRNYELFIQSLCDIMELDGAVFEAQDSLVPLSMKGSEQKAERIRAFFLKRSGDEYSSIDEYSDGTLVVTAILELLFSEEDRGAILCLEELENCLHPGVIEKMLRFLQDHADKWPVLITTHSPYLLNGVRPEDINVAVVDETGATHFEKVKNSKQLRDYLAKNLMSFGELLVKDFDGFRAR